MKYDGFVSKSMMILDISGVLMYPMRVLIWWGWENKSSLKARSESDVFYKRRVYKWLILYIGLLKHMRQNIKCQLTRGLHNSFTLIMKIGTHSFCIRRWGGPPWKLNLLEKFDGSYRQCPNVQVGKHALEANDGHAERHSISQRPALFLYLASLEYMHTYFFNFNRLDYV